MTRFYLIFIFVILSFSCNKGSDAKPVQTPQPLNVVTLQINGNTTAKYSNVTINPTIRFAFSVPVDHSSISNNILFNEGSGASVAYNATFANNDSVIIIQPASSLQYIKKYTIVLSTGLQSQQHVSLSSSFNQSFTTSIDSTDKFTRISDSALLDLVQKQTFKYFWDFGDPVSGMARERNTDLTIAATGGTGFGIMAMVVAANRGFVLRTDAVTRLLKIVNFLSVSALKYHGAFSHWINGATGATIPFGTKDEGADIVETSYLMQGLLTARQYFNSSSDASEIDLRNKINLLWNGVEWNWFRQNNQNVLYWNWSPNYAWAVNVPIRGWNEALITYVMAASSTSYSIPKTVYDSGYANNGGIKNGNVYYGITLPLGPASGGPLFFAHYSFLGINPHSLTDAYANYWTQDTAHTKINYNYCVSNPSGYNGYSNLCWGLTASDDNSSGYAAHSPTNDLGIITPSAAISSMPYAPSESMNALRFFYYKLGDKLWGQYGFTDAFNLTNIWFAPSYLAIDQGPQIIMIENYRSSLIWNLFMSCPEIKTGMHVLGFQSPNL